MTNSFKLRVHVITNESFEEHVAIDILISLGNSLQAMLKKAKEGIISLWEAESVFLPLQWDSKKFVSFCIYSFGFYPAWHCLHLQLWAGFKEVTKFWLYNVLRQFYPTSCHIVFKSMKTRRRRYRFFFPLYSLVISVEYQKNSSNKWNGILDSLTFRTSQCVQCFKPEKASTRTCN